MDVSCYSMTIVTTKVRAIAPEARLATKRAHTLNVETDAMRRNRIVLRVLIPTIVGMTVALGLSASDASAAVGCEMNACRLSTGDCDLTELHISCTETAEGCETTGCVPN